MKAGDRTIPSALDEFDRLRYVAPEMACPYLPGKLSRSEAYVVEHLDPPLYERLLKRGFRRSGYVVYRPRCRACRECLSLRVLVERFQPSRGMRRTWRRNRDVRVDVEEPRASDEKFDLFTRYLEFQHDGTMDRSYACFNDFLYRSPTEAREFCYRLGTRLVGVSLADCCPAGLSSVYMYFDPQFARRSLGTFSVLWEVAFCRDIGVPYYYLGYYVAGSPKMAYKARFRPNEVLVGDDRWVAFRS